MNKDRIWQLNFGKGQSVLVFICILGLFLFVEERVQAQVPEPLNWRDLYDWDEMTGGGFRRPGKLHLSGRKTGQTPPHFFYQQGSTRYNFGSNSVDGFTYHQPIRYPGMDWSGWAERVYSRSLGVKYEEPKGDRGQGRITSLKFAYIMDKDLSANVGKYGLFSYPKSTIGVVITQNGGFAQKQWGISSQYTDTTFSFSVFGISFPITSKSSAPARLNGIESDYWKNSDPISIPHFAGAKFEHYPNMKSVGRIEIYEPNLSWATADATWNMYIAEGPQQLSRREAIVFQSP